MALSGSEKAYLQARGGIARGGAVRGNYFLYNAVIQLTRTVSTSPFVIETVDLTRYVEVRSLQLHEAINDEIDTATFTLKPGCPWVPRAGEPIRIGVGTGANALFAGQAMTVRTRYVHGVDDPWIDVACVDHLHAFDSHLITWEWPSTPGATIIKDIVARYTSGFTTVGVASNLPNITISAINYRPSTILRTITHAAKGGFYIDPNRDLQAFPSSGPLGQLTNPRPLVPTLKSLKQFTAIDDATQIRTHVIVEGQRSAIAVPLPVWEQPPAQVSVPVRDASMFEIFPYDPGSWVTPEWRIRIGTQNYMYHYAVRQTSATQPTGALVRVAAVKGDLYLRVSTLSFLLPSEYAWGWVQFSDQVLLYEAAADGGDPRLYFPNGIPLDVSVGTSVTAVPYLREVYGRDWNQFGATPRAQPVDTPVVLQVWATGGDQEWWERMAGTGDGYRDHLVQDGRYSRNTASQRAQAELTDFSAPLKRAEWITYDLNAEVGRLQAIAMPPDGYTDLTMQITEVNITWDETPRKFPSNNLPPKRVCRAEITKRAEILDYILTDQR